ncbi:Hsp20 family protein [Paracoccus sp. SJTW-4]|uniref:Hsp20 family protein n=1 Tax=Paracoccus sp. SJTW-4 TaxID=3078428 RepID=UPI0039ED12D5
MALSFAFGMVRGGNPESPAMFPEITRPGAVPPRAKPAAPQARPPPWNHQSAAAGRRRADPAGRGTLGNRGQGPAVPGTFLRPLRPPHPAGYEVDGNAVEAGFRNGVLTVTLPKTEKAQSQVKRIPNKG